MAKKRTQDQIRSAIACGVDAMGQNEGSVGMKEGDLFLSASDVVLLKTDSFQRDRNSKRSYAGSIQRIRSRSRGSVSFGGGDGVRPFRRQWRSRSARGGFSCDSGRISMALSEGLRATLTR